ncbi:MAG: C10 family peptidase, partial [Sedimentisphaerales bacterium]|nr:C10 family peptidase [Sedimentisphaerales bacterium]
MSILTALVLLAVGASRIAHAVPVQQDDALRAAGGWVALSGRPLGEALGIPLGKAVRSLDETGRALFYHVPLRGGGFIILSTDDRLPPVVAFSATGEFVDDPEHPPAAVLRAGTARRLGFLDPPRQDANVALGTVAPNGDALKRREAEARGAWRRLLDAAGESAPVHILGLAWVSDLRVAPIMQTAWSQSMANGQNTYNYYTPNNYPAGCVATAMAQVMRVHRFPVEGIGVHARTIYVNGSGRSASTRGGDGVGGPYLWDNMPLRPAEGATEVERQAVGALCYDAGVTVEMEYTASGSTASLTDAASAMQTVFGYGDANVIFVSPRYDFQPELLPHAINANLDARLPVMLGITTAYGSHAVVCDGYGFEGGSPYHHVNMGYGGADDLWYAFVDFSPSYTIVYNLDPAGSGEIISGRVWDEGGEPLSGVSVHIGALSATTDAKGIYAVTQVAPGTQTVVAEAAGRLPSSVATEVVASVDHVTCGNQYGVDFILKPEGFTGLPEPTSVAATDGDFSDRVEITWAAVAGATHYRVHRSESAGGDRAALGAWRSATSLSDTDVVAAVTYRYWVQAAASAAGDQASALSLSDCGYADNIYSGGSGTEQDPYRIASRRDLLALAENPDDYNLHFLLTDDIDLGDMVLQTALIAPDMDGSTSDNF